MVFRSFLMAAASFAMVLAAHAGGENAKTGAKATEAAAAHTKGRPHSGGKLCCGQIYRYVYAEAWYGNRKIVAPVRRVEWGDQVQVPGGAWLNCIFSCELTIRKLRLEYWQALGAGTINRDLPYPRNDFYIDSEGCKHEYLF
ncbi:MAG: hypothetical protein WBX25_12075 [Rhodomicrobium sp.]